MIQCDICEKTFDKDGDEIKEKAALRMHKFSAHDEKKKAPETTKAKETQPKTEVTNQQLTPEQQAIASRVTEAEGARDFDTIREDELEDFSLMHNPFDLPSEVLKYQDEKVYAFRFCERTADRIDYLTKSVKPPLQWRLVNKTQLPALSHLVDPMLGGVCVLDQILLYKPWSWHQKVKDAKAELADMHDKGGNLDAGKNKVVNSTDKEVEAYTGKQYRIGSNDEVIADEALADMVTE